MRIQVMDCEQLKLVHRQHVRIVHGPSPCTHEPQSSSLDGTVESSNNEALVEKYTLRKVGDN